jgi:hypothetical protein
LPFLLLAFLLSVPASAQPEPTRPEVSGTFSQSVLPALGARRATAEARAQAADAWFDGQGTWEAAFPELVDAPLGDPKLLRTRLSAAHTRGVARAAERFAPATAGLTDGEVATWRAAVRDTADAEDRADAAEQRFLSGLLAGVERAPGLAEEAIAARLATFPTPPDDVMAEIPADVIAGDEEAQTLRAWRRAAWQAMTRPDDPALTDLVVAALAEPVTDVVRVDGLRDRLQRVAPLLESDLASQVADWLQRTVVLAEVPPVEKPGAADAEGLAVEAKKAAEQAATGSEGEVRGRTAEVRATTAGLVRAEEVRRTTALAEITAWQAELDRLRLGLADAERRTSLDRERQPLLDAAYLDARNVVDQLHGATLSARARLASTDGEEAADPAMELEGVSPGTDAAADHARAVADLRRERAVHRTAVADEAHAVVGLLIDAKGLRRAARSYASRPARLVGRRAFVPDVVLETREIPAVASFHVERVARTVRSLPSLATDMSAVYALATGSAALFAGIVAWWFLRQLVPIWATAATRRLDQPGKLGPLASRLSLFLAERIEHPTDFWKSGPVVGALARRLVDLGAALVLAWWTPHNLPGFDMVASIVLAVAVWRTWPTVVDLAFATRNDARPALRVVAPEMLSRIRKLVGWVVGWWLVAGVADAVLLDLFAADKLTQLADGTAMVVGLAILCAALWSWEPDLRAALGQLEPSRLVRSLAAPGGPVTRIPRAAAACVLLVLFHVGQFAGDLVTTSRQFRWVGTAMARRRLSETPDLAPLDDGLRARIDQLDHGVPPRVSDAIERVIAIHARWKAEGRRGMVAVTAERGAGLRLMPELLAAALTDVRSVRPPHRIHDAGRARTWLAGVLGLPSDEAGFVAALTALPRSAIIVDEAHLLFLRRAGGFDALRWMLETMQAASEKHFWVWCSDARTWAFLHDAPGAVDVGLFHEHVRIEPLESDDLDAWLLGPMTAAGLRPSFSAIARAGTDSVDPRSELRARRAYVRVVEDLSQGKPAIARLLWRASLRAGPNGAIEHAVPVLKESAILDTLGDEDLFLLTALVTHAGLDVAALGEVLNRPETRVWSACRRLESQGILVGNEQEEWFDVADMVHPTAVRVLTQRAFLDIS